MARARSETLPPAWRTLLRRLAGEGRAPRDVEELSRHIYETHFAGWRPTAPLVGRASGDPRFVEQVALSVSDAWGWEPGWEVIQRAGRSCFVHDGRMQLLVHSGEYVPQRVHVGSRVAVAMPCLREGLVPGFLYAFSRAGPIDPMAPHVRIYLNVTARGGAELMRRLLTSKEAAAHRFEAKCPNDPAAFTRRDSMVVYAEPRSARPLLRLLFRWCARGPARTRSPTPFAALRVGRGIALAESPPSDAGPPQSFGQHRSSLIARAVVESRLAGKSRPSEWEHLLIALLCGEGIDPTAPYRQRLPGHVWRQLIR